MESIVTQYNLMSNKISITCAFCGNVTLRYASQISSGSMIFCSQKCRHAWRGSGSWKPPNAISVDDALNDLRNLYSELGRYPTAKDVNAKWPHRSIWYGRRYGTVAKALESIGVVPPPKIEVPKRQRKLNKRSEIRKVGVLHRYTNEQLINELIRVAKLVGHTPTDSEFRKFGNCSTSPYWTKYGSWANACKQAGLEPHTTFEGAYHSTKRYRYTRIWDRKSVTLVGTCELRFAKKCDEIGIRWLAHGEFQPLAYVDTIDSRFLNRKYMPDFYLLDYSMYIETKGWFREKDELKMECVYVDNPEIDILVVGKIDLEYFERVGNLS